MYLHLFNGASTPEEPHEDWSEEGPTFKGVPFVQCTYGETLFIGDIFVHIYRGHIFYKGVYYGDWTTYDEVVDITTTTDIPYGDLLESDFEEPKPM